LPKNRKPERFPVDQRRFTTLGSSLFYLCGTHANLILELQINEITVSQVGIGIIGCGNISSAYLSAAKHFPILNIKALADIDPEAAQSRGREFGIPAAGIQNLLDDPEIEIVINLTVPQAHVEVGLKAVAAGKHVHSEKPLGVSVAEASRLVEAAKAKGVRLGCAPDTFLGGAQQTCRKLIDERAIGDVISGTAFFMCPGHEKWHPNPAFYYAAGGGPVLDMAPYYLTSLVNLLGPIARVTAMSSQLQQERTIESEPLKGKKIPVQVPTHVAGLLEFDSGTIVTMVMSFDVVRHAHRPIELYGSTGSLSVPDPDKFGDTIELTDKSGKWSPVATVFPYADGNYRILGAADMALAIRTGQPHRASGELAFHVLEVMEALDVSAGRGTHITIKSSPTRPAAMPHNPGFGQ
jgi:predicted dehydrogenase